MIRKGFVALLGLAVVLGGCESLRDLTYSQGKGLNLYKIADYKGKTFEETTGKRRFKGQTSRADQLFVLEGFDKINNLDAVELQFTTGLLADIELRDLIFYARPESKYVFEYDFTDHYLILFKVAAKTDIPSQELTYAEETDNGNYRVPVLGVPIALYTVEAIEDERGKDTRKLSEFPKDYLKEATHFRMDMRGIKYFDAPGKQDLIPTDYFKPEDEWFYTKTLVGRPIDSTAILGNTLQALKIKFTRTNNSILGVDLNIAKEQEVLDPTKTIVALEFPVEWCDFRLERSGDLAYLKETKLGNTEPTAKFWEDRQYGLVDFNNADRLDQAFTLDNKLEKLEIGEDYLSFNIFESRTGYTYKYSLVKVDEVQKGQKFFSEDAKLFHIFSQKRTVINGNLFTQTPDIENIVFANRFFPGEDAEIVYHLSDNSPDVPAFNEAVKIAIEAWDKAFQEAGTGIAVRFDDKRVELGDVRYNQVVLYGYEIDSNLGDGSMLLGFGPSVQDTRSGETFSAATHIYLRAYREGLIRNIRSFIRNEIGLYDDKVIPSFNYDAKTGLSGDGSSNPAGNSTPAARSDEMTGTAAIVDFVSSPAFAKKPQRAAQIAAKILNNTGKKMMLDAFYNRMGCEQNPDQAQCKSDKINTLLPTTRRCNRGNVAANAFSWERIREGCLGGKTKLTQYLKDLDAAHKADPSVMNIAGEDEAILECTQPLMKSLLISTLIHEIGHNLGLGHNFAASSDGPNFAKNDDGTVAYPYSSVMDYSDRDYDLFNKAGPYDVAAIAYLYSRTVETTDGEMLQIPEGVSAFEAAKAKGKALKPYRMCTDYEVGGSNLPLFDPLCVRWDIGANPLEYVMWAIQKIHADIIERGYRYNNAAFFGSLSATSYFVHFRQIHDYFRYLMKKQAGLYFEKVASGDFTEAQLYAVMDKTQNPELTKQYYEAVKQIFEFTRKVLKLPSRVCTLENNGDIEDVFEFRDLRNRIFDHHQITVQNCSEALMYAKEPLEDMGISDDLTGRQFADRGIEISGLELDLDPGAASTILKQYNFTTASNIYWFPDDNPLYSAGMLDLKTAALFTLFYRVSNIMSITQNAEVYNMTFVDFPWFRDALFMDGVVRVVNGIAGNEIDPRLPANKRYGHYREYQDFYWMWLISLLDSVGDLRSKAYGHILSMLPMREASQSSFSQTLASSTDIWWVQIKNAYYLYESNKSLVGQLIKVLVQIGQMPATLQIKAAIDSNKAAEEAKLNLAGVVNAEQMLMRAVEYLKASGLDLQPPQKELLKTKLPGPTEDASVVLPIIRDFLNDEIVLSTLLEGMADRGDYDNIQALNAIITDYVEAIYGA